MKQSHIREWEQNNCLINFKWALTRRKRMLLDWAIHTSLIQKRLSHSYQSKRHVFLRFFCGSRLLASVLQLIGITALVELVT